MRSLVAFAILALLPFSTNAGVIEIATDGLGSHGHAGTIDDPLILNETIELAIVLNYNPHPSEPGYDGYALSFMDLSLQYSGAGTLHNVIIEGPPWPTAAFYNSGFDLFSIEDDPYLNISDGLDQIWGAAVTPIRGTDEPTMLLWGFWARATGAGEINIDLVLNGQSQYAPYADLDDEPYPDPPGWIDMVEGDLGDLTLYVVPEPATIALLGLGGLMLGRKKQRV